MKFKSRKDIWFQIILFGSSAIFCVQIISSITTSAILFSEFIWFDILMVLVVSLLLWINFGTEYELTARELKYRSGPIQEK